MDITKEDCEKQLVREKLLCRLSRLQGYCEAMYDYAIWKNGEMVLGCGVKKYKDAVKPIDIEIKKIENQLTGDK